MPPDEAKVNAMRRAVSIEASRDVYGYCGGQSKMDSEANESRYGELDDNLAKRLRERAAEHRANGWELMREGNPDLLDEAADEIERYQKLLR